MRPPLRVSSKRKLSDALGISPPTLYAYMRLPDSPPARNGYWYVSDFRKFITKKRGVMDMSEKQQLQLDLLRAKLEREREGLDSSRAAERGRIVDEFVQSVQISHGIVRAELFRMRSELCPKFEGLSAREMFALWTERERQTYNNICTTLTKRGLAVEEESIGPTTNLVEFKAATETTPDQRKAVAAT